VFASELVYAHAARRNSNEQTGRGQEARGADGHRHKDRHRLVPVALRLRAFSAPVSSAPCVRVYVPTYTGRRTRPRHHSDRESDRDSDGDRERETETDSEHEQREREVAKRERKSTTKEHARAKKGQTGRQCSKRARGGGEQSQYGGATSQGP